MINLRAIFVISALISVLIFTPSYSFAQSNQNDSPLAGLFEFFSQLFGPSTQSEPVIEFENAVVIQSSNSTPTADAGDDQTVMEFAKVTLDGSSSTDPDGDPITYKWTQTDGPEVFTGSMTTVESPMFMAPAGDQTLTFELFVVDTSSATSEVDVVIVKVTDEDEPQSNEPADPEPPGNENGGNKVTICHAPPGNPNNAHTITVGTYAAQAHLIHHDEDTLGACGGNGVNENKKSNTGKGNNNDDDDDRKGNSGKGNQNIKDDNRNKSNSGKDKDDNANKSNSGKDKDDNANKSNSGKDKDDNANKSNSGKDKDDNANKSNSKLNNNDD